MTKHEKDGTTDSKEYHDAMDVFYSRHVCRLNPMPEDVVTAFGELEKDPTVYFTMYAASYFFNFQRIYRVSRRNGPSEFHITGSLKTWSVIDDIHKINVPTLLLNSRFDEAQDSVLEPYFAGLSKVKWYTFAESSHMPQYEERELYMQRVGGFLSQDM